MSTWESVRIAIRALGTNKMRTGLTMLGIVIGVAAVIAMVALGQGAAKAIREQFESMGTNLIVLHAGSSRMRFGGAAGTVIRRLMPEDAEVIARRFADIIPYVSQQVRGNVEVKKGSNAATTQCIGATPDYEIVAKEIVERGRFLNEREQKARARVAVLGRTVVENLANDRYANIVGDHILVNRTRFKVVGILREKGNGIFGQDQDDRIIIPCSTAMRRVFNRRSLHEIMMSAAKRSDVDLAIQRIVAFMRVRHKLRPPFPDNDDFTVRSQAQILEASSKSSQTMTALLGGVAFVSLMVGGIGIMNIMLVSVTERTREIGLRKSVGATSHHILLQFIIEALVISVMGGLFGIAFGIGGVRVVTHFLHWNAFVSASSVVLAVLVSGGVGMFFGIYPAYRAANLNPIDALRYE